jgi:hypothetical protein
LIEPSGVLDTRQARYEAISERAVRVSGSTFRKSEQYTIKLEGAELAGYQSIIIGTVRDPLILRQLDPWLEQLLITAKQRIEGIYGAGIEKKYRLDLRVIGKNATMGSMEPVHTIGHEVGLLFQVTAETQELATALMKSVSHIAVHFPIPEWSGLITSIAYPYSPAEIQRGAMYRFNMNHVVIPATPLEMFPIEYSEVRC